MNKAELVEALAEHYNGSRAEASRALNAVVQTITRSTVAGEKVAITGFGVFERVERPARMVRNPRTGERKEAAATAVPRFRPGTELKAYVSGARELPDLPVPAPAAAPSRPASRRPAAVTAQTPAAQQAATGKAAGGKKSDKASTKKAGSKADGKKADSKKDAKSSKKKKKAKSGK